MRAETRVKRWKGGRLRVYGVERWMEQVAEDDAGEPLYEPRVRRRLIGEADAKALDGGLAVVREIEQVDDSGLELRFELRDRRLQCVSISSPKGAPALTQTVLRALGSIDERAREAAVASAVRLEVDDTGELVGVLLTSPRDPWDQRSWRDVLEELGSAVPRRGRPPTSTAELERVAAVVEEAQRVGQPIGRAVEQEFSLSPDVAKKRIRKARERGLLPPSKSREART
jgi:hypothetical protein